MRGQVERVSFLVGDVHTQGFRDLARRGDDLRPVLDSDRLIAVCGQPQEVRTTPSADLQYAAAFWDDALKLAITGNPACNLAGRARDRLLSWTAYSTSPRAGA
jgi:hypothetical protein